MVITLLKVAIRRGPHHLAMVVRHPVQHSSYLYRTIKSYMRNYILAHAGIAECDMSAVSVCSIRVVWLAVRRTTSLIMWNTWFLILFSFALLSDSVRRRH